MLLPRQVPRSRVAVIGTLTLFGLTAFACADNDDMVSIGAGALRDASGPVFAPTQEAGADVDLGPSAPRALCVATECLAPYGTCAADTKCGTNLSNDAENCGACGVKCPTEFGYLNLTSSCVNGACEPACASKYVLQGQSFALDFADCNGTLEDGCEVALTIDPNNCGGCGIKCAPDVRCIDGRCGCEAGKLDCNPGQLSAGACIDVRNNDDNCGACGNVCTTPGDAGAPPPNMYYGCRDNQCGQLKCVDFFGDSWANCDNDLTNGCEVYIGPPGPPGGDTNNCGGCGIKCAPGQLCWDANLDMIPECGCKPNETMCGSLETNDLSCRDLLNDVNGCGSCFTACELPLAHQISACRKGVCERDCAPGWGDCDLDPTNGCETDLTTADAHCGACGNRCDTQAGQPCIEGRCAMRECDAGGPR